MSNAFRCINLVRLKIISNIMHSCVQKKSFIIPCVINMCINDLLQPDNVYTSQLNTNKENIGKITFPSFVMNTNETTFAAGNC